MTDKTPAVRALPDRPSLESLRKQAKTLSRAIAAGAADALARARIQLPKCVPPLSLRDAQLVIAREYGFAGWRDLRKAVLKRAGDGLEWAATEARRAIHDNDTERLRELLAEYPGLLSWRDEAGHALLQATTPFAMDVTDPKREAEFCRPDCAALLVEAGADITPSVWESLIRAGAAGMMRLLQEKNVLPCTLPVLAALGDLDGVRGRLNEGDGGDLDVVNRAFMNACRFKQEEVARTLLDRCIALDSDLDAEIDRWGDRATFVTSLMENCPSMYVPTTPWRGFVMRQLEDAMNQDDLPVFTGWLEDQPWLLDAPCLALQVELLEQAAIFNRETFIRGLLERSPAVLRSPAPPPSPAVSYALDYGNAHLIPLLAHIWPVPDDLPHAAALGNLAAVKRWFDEDGRPALGELARHHPANDPHIRGNLQWGTANVQQVLDVALAWACLNRQFEAASFLLAHGADINTNWATHEPASILHECVAQANYNAARFLVEHGIDLTIRDHRWNATAAGWAWVAAKDEKMTQFLTDAEERRNKV